MPKIANSTCVSCHQILPRTEMEQVTIVENSGSSRGLSGKLFPSANGKRNVRASARQYYRNKKVWMCHPCAKEHKKKEAKGIEVILLIVVVVVGYLLFGDDLEKSDSIPNSFNDQSTKRKVLPPQEFAELFRSNWYMRERVSGSCVANINRNNNGEIELVKINNCKDIPEDSEEEFKESIRQTIKRMEPIPLIKNSVDQSFEITFRGGN